MTFVLNGELGRRTVGRAGEFPGVEAGSARWVVRCEQHSTIGLAGSEREARAMPTAGFCAQCAQDPGWRPDVEAAAVVFAEAREALARAKEALRAEVLRAKEAGASDAQVAKVAGVGAMTVREWRGVRVRKNGKVVRS